METPAEFVRLSPTVDPGEYRHTDRLHGRHMFRFLSREFGAPDPNSAPYEWTYHLRHRSGDSIRLEGIGGAWRGAWTGGNEDLSRGEYALERLTSLAQERESVRVPWEVLDRAERRDLLLQVRDWASHLALRSRVAGMYADLAWSADRVRTDVVERRPDPGPPPRWPAFTHLPDAEKATLLRQMAAWAQRMKGPWDLAERLHRSTSRVADSLEQHRGRDR